MLTLAPWLLGPLLGACRPAAPTARPLPADAAWVRPRVPSAAAPEVSTGRTAADCGACHVEIYEEWRASTHAQAWTDAQFQAELAKDPEVVWLCLNCHTPAQDQQEQRVEWEEGGGAREVRRTVNTDFDPTWREEGVSCLACHWEEGRLVGPGRERDAPHPAAPSEALRSGQICLDCHQAAVRLEDALVCHFDTGREWQASKAAQSCVDCHMPAVRRPLAEGGPVRSTRRHGWPGSGIPKTSPPPAGFARIHEGWSSGARLSIVHGPAVPTGTPTSLEVRLENVGGGHHLPTGDPERHLLLEVDVDGPEGRVAQARRRFGQRWIWWPVARPLDDDRLAAGEMSSLRVPFVQPAPGGTVTARLWHVRLSPENAAYHGLEAMPSRREVERITAPLPFAESGD